MTSDPDSDAKQGSGWAEHTVVANLPRLFPRAAAQHAPLAEVPEPRTLIGMPRPQPPATEPGELGRPLAELEEPRTVVGEVPSREAAQALIARYAALSAEPPPAEDAAMSFSLPVRQPWHRRVARFAREDFQRAPRIVRLLLPALPLIAAATTFLDVDPPASALPQAVAVAALTSQLSAAPAPPPPAAPSLAALPTSSVTVVRHPGRTLAAEAADAAARGDRAQAIAIYAQLAREHPENPVYASAARILMRDKERDRPGSEP
jgi:hypothetical protein